MVRFKNRYFLCEIDGAEDKDINQASVLETIKTNYELFFGERGMAHVYHALTFKYFSRVTGKFLLKVPRSSQNQMQTVLALITKLGSRMVRIRILHKSGTIKQSEIKARRLFTESLHKAVKRGLASREQAEKAATIEDAKLRQIKF